MRAITVLLLILPFLPVHAEEPAAEEATPQGLFERALYGYERTRDLVVTAEVAHTKPAAPGGGMGGPGGIVIQTSFGGEGLPPFEGKIEAWRDADDRLVIASERELPGFTMIADKRREKVEKRVTYEEEPWGLAQIEAELVPLLDTKRFAKQMERVTLTPTREEATGDWIFKGEVPRTLVRPLVSASRPMGMPAFGESKLLKAEATCRVTKQGRLTEISIKLTRNDPEREMLRQFRGQIPGMPGPAPTEEEKEAHDLVGGTTTYSIRIAPENSPPPARVRGVGK